MKIVVLIKQVPDTTEVKLDRKTGNLIREGVESIVNPDDRQALELALQLKDDYQATITVISMGPPQAVDVREMGTVPIFSVLIFSLPNSNDINILYGSKKTNL